MDLAGRYYGKSGYTALYSYQQREAVVQVLVIRHQPFPGG
jgi:hypothetical protein